MARTSAPTETRSSAERAHVIRRTSALPFAFLLFALTGLGCGGGTPATTDAAVTHDAGTDASASEDAATSPDTGAGNDAGSQADAGGSGTAVALDYRSHQGTLDRAWLGYHRTSGTIDGVYFEINRGGDAACPSATSPVPSQLISLDAITSAAVPFTRTEADGVMVQFFDFEGTFRTEVAPAVPTALSVEVTALDTTAGTASANVTLTFGTDGTATGTLVATHCDSLDSGS